MNYKGMLKKVLNKEFILYIIFGILTTLVNIASFWLFTRVFPLSDNYDICVATANVVAWVLSVLFAYVTNKIWVFESRAEGRELLKEIFAFFSCRIASLILDMAVIYVGVTILTYPDMPVKLASNVLVVIFNYIFSKLLIFKNGGESNE